jgi:hypothetical protein
MQSTTAALDSDRAIRCGRCSYAAELTKDDKMPAMWSKDVHGTYYCPSHARAPRRRLFPIK